jgi:hypothetical protein
MADYEYSIGTSPGALNNLEDDLGIPPPHPAPFREWAATYEAGDGRTHGDGWPSVVWTWTILLAPYIGILRTYCSGKSATVYIKTLKADLTTYGTYSAIMHWPTMPDDFTYRPGRAVLDFSLQFTHLEEVS